MTTNEGFREVLQLFWLAKYLIDIVRLQYQVSQNLKIDITCGAQWHLLSYYSFFCLAIILLFLNLKLGYDKDISTAIYHTYEFVAYFFAIVGGAIADSWLGMYRSIVLTTSVFAAGAFLISFAVVDSFNLPIK